MWKAIESGKDKEKVREKLKKYKKIIMTSEKKKKIRFKTDPKVIDYDKRYYDGCNLIETEEEE
jgi:hypothetical protein